MNDEGGTVPFGTASDLVERHSPGVAMDRVDFDLSTGESPPPPRARAQPMES